MNRLLSTVRCVVLAATLPWFAAGIETASAAVRIIVPSSALAGDLLDVQLLVNSAPGGGSDGLTSLGGFDNGTFTLFFDPDVFEIPPGNTLQLSSLLPAPFGTQPANTSASMSLAIVYAAALPDSTPLGVIASGQLGVRPGAPVGPTGLRLRIDFNGGDFDFDEEFNPLARTFQALQAVVVVPEPSGWVMLLIGLAGIGLIWHRRLGLQAGTRIADLTIRRARREEAIGSHRSLRPIPPPFAEEDLIPEQPGTIQGRS